MKRYDYLLFDLDGTLTYSHEGIYACLRHTLRVLGRPEPDDKTLRKCVGPPLFYDFAVVLGLGEELAARATEIYRAEYARTGMWQNKLVEGAETALETLKKQGYVSAIATSKAQNFADGIADGFGIAKYFQAVVGSGLDGSLNTKAAVINAAMERLGATRENCLMIGDRRQDVEGARENGIDCAILLCGYGEDGEFETLPPTYTFRGFKELTEFLRR